MVFCSIPIDLFWSNFYYLRGFWHRFKVWKIGTCNHFFQLSVEEAALSQRQKSVQLKKHHKKMAEAYENCEIIFKVIKLMSIDLESCRQNVVLCHWFVNRRYGLLDVEGRYLTKCRMWVFLITGTALFTISTFDWLTEFLYSHGGNYHNCFTCVYRMCWVLNLPPPSFHFIPHVVCLNTVCDYGNRLFWSSFLLFHNSVSFMLQLPHVLPAECLVSADFSPPCQQLCSAQ